MLVVLVFAAGLFSAPPQRAHAQAQVGKWDRFEASVTNKKRYKDPYTDVTLEVTFTKPNGSKVKFWGFYDGGNTWRIRFMPDQTGTWTYEARFSDGSPAENGSFRCVPSKIPGMVYKHKENARWFGFKGGDPVFIRAFHGGPPLFARNFPKSKRKAFLDWVERQGYNALSVNDWQLSQANGGSWDLPKTWPLNAADWQHYESVLDDLARRGLILYPFGGVFPREVANNRAEPRLGSDRNDLIDYYIARLGAYWNIMFNVGGWESDDYLGGTSRVASLGKRISERDPYGHLLSAHINDLHHYPGERYPYRGDKWSNMILLQGLEDTNLNVVAEGLRKQHTGDKPLFAQETLWLGNSYQDDFTKIDHLRRGLWTHLMSGVAGFCVGDMNGNNTSGFSGSLDLSDRVQERHDVPKKIFDFFETVPYYEMAPRPDLASRGFSLADPGSEYLVYLPQGGRTDVRVEGGKTYKVTWVDGRNPSRQIAGGSTRDGRDLKAPNSNDWVLRLSRVQGGDDSAKPATNDAPTIALDAPADGATFRAPADIALKAEASDADGSVVKVEFYADGVKIGEDRGRPFSYNWTSVPAGSYRLTAKATDNDGAQATSAAVNVNVAGRAGGGIVGGPGKKLPVARADASRSQNPNVPGNTLDANTDTRWSAEGKGQWIRYELDNRSKVDRVGIAWYRGGSRRASFEVETSTDGKAWTPVFSGRSSGRSRQVETYNVADRDARYVRIVGQGNTSNDWNSITEVEIYGAQSGNGGGGGGGADDALTYVWLEAETGSPTRPLRIRRNGAASGGKYIEAPNGRHSKAAPPANGRAKYRFSVSEAGAYRVWGRVIAENRGKDSFWIRMDGGDWVRWNEIAPGKSWRWDAVHDADRNNAVVDFRLSSGAHTLEVAYRELGARLDKLLITDDRSFVPNGNGEATQVAAKAETEPVARAEQIETESVPTSYHLGAAYPNPFNPATTISYHLPEAAHVSLSVYNVAGQLVATLVDGKRPAGAHQIRWDSRDATGLPVPSGLYFYRIETENFRQTRKMTLLK